MSLIEELKDEKFLDRSYAVVAFIIFQLVESYFQFLIFPMDPTICCHHYITRISNRINF